MQFTVLQNWESINADYDIRVRIRKDEWQKWYKEMMRRFSDNTNRLEKAILKTEEKTYDVDECQELWVIWIEHLTECLAFLANNK